MKFSNKVGQIIYEESYWDARVLDCDTINILSIAFYDENDLNKLIPPFIELIKNKYCFISYRSQENNNSLKKILLENNFIIVEKSYLIEGRNINIESIRRISDLCKLKSISTKAEVNAVKEIAEEEFDYGRFFEDPFISESIAKKRNSNWVNDIIESDKTEVVLLHKKDSVIGFMAFEEKDEYIELLLGGVKSSYAHLAYGFWGKFFNDYCGQKLIRTTISCSNLPVVNLYSFMGFRFKTVLTGFHLHTNK